MGIFWEVVQFMRDFPAHPDLRRTLFSGVFPSWLAYKRNSTCLRQNVISPGCQATQRLVRLAALNGLLQNFLLIAHLGSYDHSPIYIRDVPHMKEAKFLTDVVCSAIWSQDSPELPLRGITGNTCPIFGRRATQLGRLSGFA